MTRKIVIERSTLLRTADELEKLLQAMSERDGRLADKWAERRPDVDQMMADISRINPYIDWPLVREDWNGASLNYLGVRATSTSSIVSACHNWITLVRKKHGTPS